MAKRSLPKETWDALVAAYREAPNNHSRAAVKAGVSRETARQAWNEGLRYPWATIPIKEVLAEERAEAAAQVQREKAQADASRRSHAQEVADLAHAQSVQAIADELKAADLARRVILGDLAVTTSLVPTAHRMATQIRERIEGGEKVALREATSFFRALGVLVSGQTEALRVVQEVRRRLEEKPDLVVQVDSNVKVATLQEAADAVKQATEILELARAQGIDLTDTTPRLIEAEFTSTAPAADQPAPEQAPAEP